MTYSRVDPRISLLNSRGSMCKVKVAIDTSTLRSDARLSSGPMEALTRFAETGRVEILIPFVVAGEFTSKPSAKIESLEELHKTLKKLKHSVPSESPRHHCRVRDAHREKNSTASKA